MDVSEGTIGPWRRPSGELEGAIPRERREKEGPDPGGSGPSVLGSNLCQPKTSLILPKARSISSLVMTRGGAKRMIQLWVSLQRSPFSFRAVV